jgi:alanyl-tRNA synthetase
MLTVSWYCWQGVSNNYETDLLRPIMDRAAELAGISYDSADERSQTSLKVRSLAGWRCSFAIAK